MEEFRKYLAKELKGLILDEDSWNEADRCLAEEDRSHFLQRLQFVPRQDPRFWQVLKRAEEQEKLHPRKEDYYAENWVKDFLRKDFAQE